MRWLCPARLSAVACVHVESDLLQPRHLTRYSVVRPTRRSSSVLSIASGEAGRRAVVEQIQRHPGRAEQRVRDLVRLTGVPDALLQLDRIPVRDAPELRYPELGQPSMCLLTAERN